MCRSQNRSLKAAFRDWAGFRSAPAESEASEVKGAPGEGREGVSRTNQLVVQWERPR